MGDAGTLLGMIIVLVVSIVIMHIYTKKMDWKLVPLRAGTAEKAPVVKSVPAPSLLKSYGTSEKTKVVKTIYRYEHQPGESGKWKCRSCEIENSRMTDYCELCGARIREGA